MKKSVKEEQVRKRGLPPPLLGLDERGQAPLPDLFFFTGLENIMVKGFTTE
jgi:hypothetical protein